MATRAELAKKNAAVTRPADDNDEESVGLQVAALLNVSLNLPALSTDPAHPDVWGAINNQNLQALLAGLTQVSNQFSLYSPGLTAAPAAWAPNTQYAKFTTVTQGGYYWTSALDHLSGSTFSGSVASGGNWVQGSPTQAGADGRYAIKVAPSGDTTGATDTPLIQAALATGACHLIAGATYWVNGQLVVPDNGYLGVGGRGKATIRQAAGSNLQVPLVANQNFVAPGGVAGAAPSTASFTGGVIAGLVIDVNCTAQDYTGQAWLTAGPNYVNGPDALTISGRDLTVDAVDVLNPARHGIVTTDASAGTNTIGIYSGVGDIAGGSGNSQNLYGYRMRCTVTGYSLYNGRVTVTGLTTTAGQNTATLSAANASVKPGMVAYGAGVAPNTIVTAVSGTTVTFSQNLTTNCGTTLYFAWGQRLRWNIADGSGDTDSWELPGCEYRGGNGDWVVKFDATGGWRIAEGQYWAAAYGIAQFLTATKALTRGMTFANMGQSANTPVQIGATANAINAGSGTSNVLALQGKVNVALPQYTPLVVIPPTGDPIATALSAPCGVNDTQLAVYSGKNQTGAVIPAGAAIRIPCVGRQAQGFSTDGDHIVYTNEQTGNDVIYYQDLSIGTATVGGNFTTRTGTRVVWNGSRTDNNNPAKSVNVAVTAGQSVVQDSRVKATDVGFPVASNTPGAIPAGCYVANVQPGVSFELSSSPTSDVPVAATAAATSVNINITGASSDALSFIAAAPGNWAIREPRLLVQGVTTPKTTYTVAGSGTCTFPDYPPGGSAAAYVPVRQLLVPTTPTPINSTTAQMVGLAAQYTPSVNGTVKVRISGLAYTGTAAVNYNLVGRYGTGAPPANAATPTGTTFPQGTLTYSKASSFSQGQQFSTVALLTGLTLGTPIWVDLAAWSNASGDSVTFSGVVVEFDE